MRRVVFLLPHPDDEFAVALPLRDLVRAGAAVDAVFLTDGGFGGQNVDRREAESRAVLGELGLVDAGVHFLGRRHALPDGGLYLHLDRALSVLETWLAARESPDVIHLPAWEGGHQDHDAAHLLGLALGRSRPQVALRQFPLYRPVAARGPMFRVMSPLAENGAPFARYTTLGERIGHLRLCTRYRSQWRSWLGLLPLTLLHHLADGRFTSQPVDPARVQSSPQPGAPLYERRGFLGWQAFADATADFRRALQPAGEDGP